MLQTSVECPKIAAWKSKCQVGVLLNSSTLWDDEWYKFAVRILCMLLSNIAPTWEASVVSCQVASYIIHIIATNKPYYLTRPLDLLMLRGELHVCSEEKILATSVSSSS